VTLDGFVAGTKDEGDHVHAWYFKGDTDLFGVFKVSAASAAVIQEEAGRLGAIVCGKRTFDVSTAWAGRPPMGVHHFVVTHNPVGEWVKPGSPFTFVTDGVSSAIAQAKAHAGEKDVIVSTANVMRQCLRAGLIDEIHIDLVPVILGAGVPMFEGLGGAPIELEQMRVVEGTGVTHIAYRVIK
jgi:dihydrofolate reductase